MVTVSDLQGQNQGSVMPKAFISAVQSCLSPHKTPQQVCITPRGDFMVSLMDFNHQQKQKGCIDSDYNLEANLRAIGMIWCDPSQMPEVYNPLKSVRN